LKEYAQHIPIILSPSPLRRQGSIDSSSCTVSHRR